METPLNQDSIYVDGRYHAEHPDWHQADSAWKARNIRQMIEAHKLKLRTVCEVGCGAGEILRCLSMELGDGVTMWGYEISPQAYLMCRGKEKENLIYRLGDLLAIEDARFDLVMAIDVFEHIEDCFDFLRRLRAKGLYKMFHIPLDLSAQSVLRETPLLKQRRSVGHIHYFTKELALDLLREAGYEILDAKYTRGSLELPDRGWKATLMKLPRRAMFMLHKDIACRLLGGFSLLVLAK